MAVWRYVAPRVGAWIETPYPRYFKFFGESHPVWVRGLKLQYLGYYKTTRCRTPCGCVD